MKSLTKLQHVLDTRSSTKDHRKRADPYLDLELSGLMIDLESFVLSLFMDKVVQTDTCWIWTSAQNQFGYGLFTVDYKTHAAHRWSYEYFIGPVAPRMDCLHTCDFRNCVNPEHLWQGTPKQNIDDMCAKSRHRSMPMAPHRTGSPVTKSLIREYSRCHPLCKKRSA